MESHNSNIEKRQSVQGNRGKITTRPQSSRASRDSIVRNYTAQGAARARNARMQTNEAMRDFQLRERRNQERLAQRKEIDARRREEEKLRAEYRRAQREKDAANARTENAANASAQNPRRSGFRVRKPLTSQESHDQTEMSREQYEQARARRDVLATDHDRRTSNREIIDGRGSIDSRAFNERNELVGYSLDERDRHDPMIDSINSKSKWRSHASQGFSSSEEAPRGVVSRGRRRDNIDSLSDTISGRSDYARSSGFSEVPASIKLLAVIIAVLIIVLVVILIF